MLCLISGGGSALLTLPAEGLTLADKQRINKQLLESGAHIGEMNCVRKHLSRIKGGRLAAACAPAQVVTLTISDVPGDDPAVIASGPTVPDATTCADALAILDRYRIEVPPAGACAARKRRARNAQAGRRGVQGPCHAPDRHAAAIAGSGGRRGARGRHRGPHPQRRDRRRVARSRQGACCAGARGGAARRAVRQALRDPVGRRDHGHHPSARSPAQAKGRGGRAGEFCLGLAGALAGQKNVWALAADTDGIDGVEDNAGAFVTPDTLARAEAAGSKLADHLDRNDAYGYFDAIGDLCVTGPTHTNVNDFRALLIL